ncbi:MAG: hypothetical protein PVF05_03155 [Gemmatimonadales bacterium]|jgi:hypothetical protein
MRGWVLGLIVIVAAGCARDSGSNTGSSGTEASTRPYVEALRIDRPEAEGGFGRIGGLTVDSAGRIWILDASNLRIFVHDTLGHRLFGVGREGQGPGELVSPIGLFPDREGRVWVSDFANQRYSAFDERGELSEERARGIVGNPLTWRARQDPDGSFAESGAGIWGRVSAETVFRLDTTMAKVDSFRVGEPLPHFELPTDASVFLPIPWGTRYVWTLASDGSLWLGHGRPYEIFRVSWAGDTIARIRRREKAPQVEPAERDSVLARLDSLTGLPISAQAERVPDRRPFIARLHAADDGKLWVRRSSGPSDPPTWFDVFSPDGDFVATVTSWVHLRLDPVVVWHEQLYGVTTDDLGRAAAVVLTADGPGEP